MMGKVEVARRNEARALRKQQLMGTANMWLGWVLHAAHSPTVSISDRPCQPIQMLLSIGLPCHHRFFIPSAVTAASFYAYTRLSDKPLTSAIAFASLAWFDILRTPLWSLPFLIQNLVQVNISLKWVLTFSKVLIAPVSGAAGLTFICRLPGAHAPLRALVVPWRLVPLPPPEPSRRLHSFLNKGRRAGFADPTAVPEDVVAPPALVASASGNVLPENGLPEPAEAAIAVSHCTLSWFGDESMSKGEGACLFPSHVHTQSGGTTAVPFPPSTSGSGSVAPVSHSVLCLWISGSDVNSFCCSGLVYLLDYW
jgi:hypothetical protein